MGGRPGLGAAREQGSDLVRPHQREIKAHGFMEAALSSDTDTQVEADEHIPDAPGTFSFRPAKRENTHLECKEVPSTMGGSA